MKKRTVLEKLGFSQKESDVYFTLLRGGEMSPSDIVKESGLHRPEVYSAIAVLADRQLISVVPKGKYKKYVAAPPEKLEEIFKSIQDEFFADIEDVHRQYEEKGKRPLVTFTEGDDSIRSAFSTMVRTLDEGEMYYRYSSNSALREKKLIPKDYRAIRDAKGLERWVITNEPTKAKHTLSLGRQIKAIPKDFDLFTFDVSQLIYRDTVAIIDYNSKSVITIKNDKFAEFQKKIFKFLFKKL